VGNGELERGVILGTAGHIDHGKTTLVKALTGVDTDRLPEEKKRGITIDLGFAPLQLDGIGTVGVVDVPGHEAFVRTMVAGAAGIDIALFVIAADEGVMPQTREHLAILEHLGVSRGVVALTKSDMAEPDWLDLVKSEVQAFLATSSLSGAPVIPVSATKGTGLDQLRAALIAAVKSVPVRESADLFRLPVDRVFTVKGTGTVVTGTVWSGSLVDAATVRILPQDRSVRVRGLQTHNHATDSIGAGARAAIALAGVEVDELSRGNVVVTDPSWQSSRGLRAEITIDPKVKVGPRTRLRFHIGTSEVGARLLIPAGQPDEGPRYARLILDAPVVPRAGDRFVLRRSSPLETIGGGVVVDPLPPKRARAWPTGLAVAERFERMVAESGTNGVSVATLPQRTGTRPLDLDKLVKSRKGIERIGDRLLMTPVIEELSKQIRKLVADHHREHPLDKGAPVNELRAGSRVPEDVFEHVLQELVTSRKLTNDGGLIRQPGFSAGLSGAEDTLAKAALRDLTDAGSEPPTVAELSQKHGPQLANVMRFLERTKEIVQVEPGRYYTASTLSVTLDRLRSIMSERREYTPAEIREAMGTSRKFLIPLLEYCDRQGLTIRTETGRTWRNP
jgi:selenocysteine-specific elongation factor